MLKQLKIVSNILFTLLITFYSFLVLLGLFGFYSLPLIYMGGDFLNLGMAIWSLGLAIFLIVGLFGSASGLLILRNPNINIFYRLPFFLFLPLGILYWWVDKKIKKIESNFYLLYDSSFSKIFLIITSIVNYSVFSFFLVASLMTGLFTTSFMFWAFYMEFMIFLISLSMLIGTTANIYNYIHQNKIARVLSYGEFNVIFAFKIHQKNLIKE